MFNNSQKSRDKLEEYSLRQIFRQIVNICEKIETFSVEELWKWTKFDGINEYLNNSLVIHEYSGVPIKGRIELLDNQSIKGNYLLFDFVGHLPEYDIRLYSNFDELIETIISDGGILNQFTTIQIPIINGIAKNILFVSKYKNETSFENELEKETIEKLKNEIIKICEQ